MANVGLIDLVRRVAAGEALTDELKGRIRATIKTAPTPELVDVYKKLRSVCQPQDTFKLPPNCLWIKQEICDKTEQGRCDALGNPLTLLNPASSKNEGASQVGANLGFSMPEIETSTAAPLLGEAGPTADHPEMHNSQSQSKPTSR